MAPVHDLWRQIGFLVIVAEGALGELPSALRFLPAVVIDSGKHGARGRIVAPLMGPGNHFKNVHLVCEAHLRCPSLQAVGEDAVMLHSKMPERSSTTYGVTQTSHTYLFCPHPFQYVRSRAGTRFAGLKSYPV